MFYLIYKITNNINKKIYVGSHKTKNKNDGYMGSGKYLNRAINKHGIENFTKEILFVFDNAKEMYDKEAEIVDADFLAEENTYNLKRGGFGGFDYINDNRLNGFINKAVARSGRASTDNKLLQEYGDNWRSVIGKKGSAASIIAIKEKRDTDPKFNQLCIDTMAAASKLAQSASAQKKRNDTFAKIKHQSGSKNSQFGKCWICNPALHISKMILKSDTVPDGWVKGRNL